MTYLADFTGGQSSPKEWKISTFPVNKSMGGKLKLFHRGREKRRGIGKCILEKVDFSLIKKSMTSLSPLK
jgi:hypothetical protein